MYILYAHKIHGHVVARKIVREFFATKIQVLFLFLFCCFCSVIFIVIFFAEQIVRLRLSMPTPNSFHYT